MSKRLKLTKIELETKAGKKVELSIDEARELHEQLDELFGNHYVPSQPIIIERDRYPYRFWWQSPTISNEPYFSPNTTWVSYNGNDSGLQISYTGNEVTA